MLAFAIALSLVTGVAFGLAPALKATRVDLLPTLRDEGLPPIDHRRLTLKNALIVVQVAVSVLLLGGTSIFLQQAGGGESACASAMPSTAWRCSRPTCGSPATRAAAAWTVYDELLRRIAAIPGVAIRCAVARPADGARWPWRSSSRAAAGDTGSTGRTRR